MSAANNFELENDENEHIVMSQSSEMDENQLQDLEESAKPPSTKRSTVYGVKKFTDWLDKRSLDCNFHSVTPEQLNELLRKFYAEVKGQKQGVSLTPSTLTCLRAAIHRHLTCAPYNRTFNLINDGEFTTSNNMFSAKCKLFFKAGNPKPKHKPAIGEGDMLKLGEYFTVWQTNPTVLLECCWFMLCYHFGRRGREGWATMTKGTYCIQHDTEGHEYVTAAITETTKNQQGGHKQKDLDYVDQRMYGPGVEIYKFYISKLHPNLDRLFQTPLKTFQFQSHWYRAEPMGKNPLGQILQTVSKKAGLSCVYTCHSVRSSMITKLYHAGVPTQSIIAITKHKNTSSLKHYIEDLSTEQKREYSGILASAIPLGVTSTVTSESQANNNSDVPN